MLLALRMQETTSKTIGDGNMKCISEVKLVKQYSDINVWVMGVICWKCWLRLEATS